MYYKIISQGQIIDATPDDQLNYVRWQKKNGLFLNCEAEQADGIISSGGSEIYLLEDAQAEHFPETPTVTLVEITEEEYLQIRDELDAGNEIANPGGNEQQSDDSPAKTRMAQLESLVADLQAQNDMLAECLMEMSEIVYG